MSGSVNVNPMDLVSYGGDLVKAVAQAQGQLTGPFTGISEHAAAAFLTYPGGTNLFAEASTAYNVNSRNLNDFQAFIKDVGTGLQAIMSAATSMAVVYATTDGDSADSVNSVDFAFAGTTSAPAGFPTKGVSTMSDQQMAADDAAGNNTTAAAAADDPNMLQYATSKTSVPGGVLYTFADGSRLQITTATGQSMYLGQSSRTVSIYKQGQNKPATVITTGDSTDYSGQPTKSKTTQTLTSGGKYVSSSESTTKLAGGGVSVTTTSTGTDGVTHTTTTNVAPPPKQAPAPSTLGEIEKREQQYQSTGTMENMQYGKS